MRRRFQADELPSVIPVFPLSGALLLPEAQLPLNVFEPRYLAMVDEALHAERLIGMIQPESEAAAELAVPKLATIGCVGRITQFLETDDGRYLITLTGLARFRRVRELSSIELYRQCEVDYTGFHGDLELDNQESAVNRNDVLAAFRAFADAKRLEVDWEQVEAAPSKVLINALAMIGPFGMREKQALLEARDLCSRAEILIAIAEFEIAKSDASSSSLQ